MKRKMTMVKNRVRVYGLGMSQESKPELHKIKPAHLKFSFTEVLSRKIS
jgi:hypothetical protein